MKLFPIAVAAALIISPLSAYASYAADGTTVDLTPVWQVVIDYAAIALGAVVSALMAWGLQILNKHTGIVVDAKYRDSLHSAAVTGINAGLARLGGKLPKSVDVKSSLVSEAINWIETTGAPAAVAHFGLSKQDIENLVMSKLQAALGVTDQTTPAAK